MSERNDEPVAKRRKVNDAKIFGKQQDKVYIGNLDCRIGKTHIEKLLQPYGTIDEVVLMEGYGFCQFLSPSEAETAIEALHGRTLMGRTLKVAHANEKSTRTKHHNVNKRETIDEKIRKLRSIINGKK
mmetsp:Transcript_8655/g.13339  ORF Transcript_8655/g.13339 Transcript_8655/m.13339 type:complete len:128 (-) Transcript_8655:449-832(-)|eukprot:CAMPEP_0178922496 /NCGR_PEP_ID=MMETSP0786-20121207/16187_1 /TAXON_ID=186022 /ORGANISM="Thalassionema frauenfeldii, Strain CCMP 1798" /LENGTH=127 /DNA_ID=CAMNT_0020596869 /DNA_START=22 /DNA_END=405 /DNA_ORIENTATION=+